ncbi:uncharacterized protein [Nicotiana tomentosiformis]|uniref:uncharacterized protein n=1 Tax=Nicotiana tomentosiformis TaxID=4098 RepID=UPI00388CC7B0
MYKLLNEQREGEVKSLQAELDASHKKHADLVKQVKIFEVSDDELDTASNGQNSQFQQKVDRVDQFRVEMDEVNVMAEELKGKMDRLASKKKTAREKLASVKAQLRSVKEKAEIRSQNIEDLQSQLGSAVAARDTLAKELEAAKSAAEITRADAEEMVAQYKVDAGVAQERLKAIDEYVRWKSRRKALEKVHARGFDLSAEIENVKRLEVEAKK